MDCPRCGSADFRFVCQGCGLPTPLVIEELSAALKEVWAAEVAGSGIPLFQQIRQRLISRGVLVVEEVDAVLERLPRVDQPPAAASAAPAAVPESGSTAALDHWSAAVKLKGHEFRFALGFTILALVIVSLVRAIDVEQPWQFILVPVVGIGWCAVTALQWYHLRRIGPDVLWQLDMNVAAAHAQPLAGRNFVEQVMSSERPAFTREQVAGHWQKKGTEAEIAGRFEEAIEMHSRAVCITPTHGARKGRLALCLVIQGCRTSDESMQALGLRTFREALTFGRDPNMLFNYAQALRMTGRPSDALPVVQEILTMTPEDPQAQALLRELGPPTIH